MGFKEWLGTPSVKREDYADIIEDTPTQVEVYRSTGGVSRPGFANELPNYTLVKRMTVLITKLNDHKRNRSTLGSAIEYDLVATAQDTDIQLFDKWKCDGVDYLVDSFDNTDMQRTEVYLKRFNG